MSNMIAKAMSAKNRGCTIWMRNKEWYRFDSQKNKYTLTDRAPKEARDSFEQYKRINNLKWDD